MKISMWLRIKIRFCNIGGKITECSQIGLDGGYIFHNLPSMESKINYSILIGRAAKLLPADWLNAPFLHLTRAFEQF